MFICRSSLYLFLLIGYLYCPNLLYVILMEREKYEYAQAVAYNFFPAVGFNEETGEDYPTLPYVYDAFEIEIWRKTAKFPCEFDEFSSNREIADIVNAYDGKIDMEKLYYAVMFSYFAVEFTYTNAYVAPLTIRQQLKNLLSALGNACRLTVTPDTAMKNENGTYSYKQEDSVRITSETVIQNLYLYVNDLLSKDSLKRKISIGDKYAYADMELDATDINVSLPSETVTYPSSKKAWRVASMLKWLFDFLKLPNKRARKSLDVSKYDEKNSRSYSLNRLVALILHLLRYTDSTEESYVKGLMSKYKDFDPNTMSE